MTDQEIVTVPVGATLKYKIAKCIAHSYCGYESPTYEQLLESIYDNAYRVIHKVPVQEFILGVCSSFIIKDEEHINRILVTLKKVVQESLEMSGCELTFTDSDWDNLKIIKLDKHWRKPYEVTINSVDVYKAKGYMSEFFEI